MTRPLNPCPLCKAASTALWNDARARRLCSGCGVVWNPTPNPQGFDEYSDDYFERFYSSRGPGLIASFGKHLDQLKPCLSELGGLGESRWLDLGCGGGFFAAAAQARGWSVTGMDPSGSALRLARSIAPAGRFLPGTIHDLPAGELFDAISFWDSIAYVPDLPDVLDLCRQHLVPGGRLLIKTPHMPARFHKATHLGLWWRPGLRDDIVNSRSTFWYFTPSSLGQILRHHNLETFHRLWTGEVPIPGQKLSLKGAVRECVFQLLRLTIGRHRSFVLVARTPAGDWPR